MQDEVELEVVFGFGLEADAGGAGFEFSEVVCGQAGAFGSDEEAAPFGEELAGGGEGLFVLEGFSAGIFVALHGDAKEGAEKPFAERRGEKAGIGEEVHRSWHDGSGIQRVEYGCGVVGGEDAGTAFAQVFFALYLRAPVVEPQGRLEYDFKEVKCEVHEDFHGVKIGFFCGWAKEMERQTKNVSLRPCTERILVESCACSTLAPL